MSQLTDILRPGQVAAIRSFKRHFIDEDNDRGTIVMCCGSGKTRTMYEIIKLINQSVYVIVTSRRALVRQIITSFSEWNDRNLRGQMSNISIFKNGDGDKIADHIHKIKINLQKRRVSIIISTYHSLEQIKYNFSKHDIPINLIIYDEAHNTVGDEGKKAQGTIHIADVPLIVNKHLFMTATPIAFYKYNKYASGPGEDTIYTMDNVETYGEVIFNYSFNDAIRDGVITDWDVYPLRVAENCNPFVGNFIDRLESATKQEQYTLGLVFLANLINKIIVSHELNNMIIYLNGVEEINELYKALKQHAPDVEPFKIHSNEGSDSLEKIITNLKPYRQCVLACGMLDEGTDIPSCDSVLFVKDEIQENKIIQRIGRALRKFPGKDRAKIFIPTIITSDGNAIINNSFVKTREVIEKLGKDSTNLFTMRNFNIAKFKALEAAASAPVTAVGAAKVDTAGMVELHDDDITLITNMTNNLEAYNLDGFDGISSMNIENIKALIKATSADSIIELYDLLKVVCKDIYIHDLERFVSYAELFERETVTIEEFCKRVKLHFPHSYGNPVKKYLKEYSDNIITNLDAGNSYMLNLFEGMPIIPELYYKDYVSEACWPFNDEPLNEQPEKPIDDDETIKKPRISANPIGELVAEIKYSLIDNKFNEHHTNVDLKIIKQSLKCNKILINVCGKNKKALKDTAIMHTFNGSVPQFTINLATKRISPMKGGLSVHMPKRFIAPSDAINGVILEVLSEIEKTYGFA